MNAIEALHHADPARGLPVETLDPRAEGLLRDILAIPVDGADARRSSAPAAQGHPRRKRPAWKPVLVTVAVAALVAGVAMVVIRSAPATNLRNGPAATTTPRTTLDAALEATLPEGAWAAPALTFTDTRTGAQGGAIHTAGRTLLIAAVCDGGGTITITVSGMADTTVDCTYLSTAGPIDVRTSTAPADRGIGVDVVATSGHPRYVAKVVAILDSSPATLQTCAGNDLTLTTGRLEGAAGTDYGSITITNHGDTACTLRGTPTAFLTNKAGGSAIGAPAGHTGPSDPAEDAPVTLAANGGRASLGISIVNIAGYATTTGYEKACGHAVTGNGWSITLPGADTALYAPFTTEHRLLCSSSALSISSIGPVTADKPAG